MVLAGHVPEIRARGWKIAVVRPGAYALEELEAALLRIAVDRLRGRHGAGLGCEGATRAAAELVRGAQQPRRCRCLQPRRKLATAGEDTTGRVWDLRTGKATLTVSGPKLYLTSVAFSPDGRRLAIGSRDGTVWVYVLPADELTAVARARLTRGWTNQECARYLPGGRCPSRA